MNLGPSWIRSWIRNWAELAWFTRCDVICDLLQHTTHTEKCTLFVLYNKNSNSFIEEISGMKKEKQVC